MECIRAKLDEIVSSVVAHPVVRATITRKLFGCPHWGKYLYDDFANRRLISREIQRHTDTSQIDNVVIDVTEGLVVSLLITLDELRAQLARALGAERDRCLNASFLQSALKFVRGVFADFFVEVVCVLV